MTKKNPPEQEVSPMHDEAQKQIVMVRMLLDLVHQTMLSAPPRTWVQSANHPGSRYWLTASLSAASQLLDRPFPMPPSGARRADTIRHLANTVEEAKAAGTWAEAAAPERRRLAVFIETSTAPFPSAIAQIARSGLVPFSPREMERVRRRESL